MPDVKDWIYNTIYLCCGKERYGNFNGVRIVLHNSVPPNFISQHKETNIVIEYYKKWFALKGAKVFTANDFLSKESRLEFSGEMEFIPSKFSFPNDVLHIFVIYYSRDGVADIQTKLTPAGHKFCYDLQILPDSLNPTHTTTRKAYEKWIVKSENYNFVGHKLTQQTQIQTWDAQLIISSRYCPSNRKGENNITFPYHSRQNFSYQNIQERNKRFAIASQRIMSKMPVVLYSHTHDNNGDLVYKDFDKLGQLGRTPPEYWIEEKTDSVVIPLPHSLSIA